MKRKIIQITHTNKYHNRFRRVDFYFQDVTLNELHSSKTTTDIEQNEIHTKQDGESGKPFSKELSIIGRVQRVFFERVITSDQSSPFVLNLRDKYNQIIEINKETDKLRYVTF